MNNYVVEVIQHNYPSGEAICKNTFMFFDFDEAMAFSKSKTYRGKDYTMTAHGYMFQDNHLVLLW